MNKFNTAGARHGAEITRQVVQRAEDAYNAAKKAEHNADESLKLINYVVEIYSSEYAVQRIALNEAEESARVSRMNLQGSLNAQKAAIEALENAKSAVAELGAAFQLAHACAHYSALVVAEEGVEDEEDGNVDVDTDATPTAK